MHPKVTRTSHAATCPHSSRNGTICLHCPGQKEDCEHWLAKCITTRSARQRFHQNTGIEFTKANYLPIIALDAKHLKIDATTLSTALFRMLNAASKQRTEYDRDATNHTTSTNTASVTHSLGSSTGSCIQRRSMVIAYPHRASTRAPT